MRPPPLRTIVSSQALMSSLTDAVGTEMVYDTVLYPQLNQDTLANRVGISVFYISIVVSIVVMQKYLEKKQIVHKWRNMRSYQLSKKQIRAILLFLFTFFVRNIESVN